MWIRGSLILVILTGCAGGGGQAGSTGAGAVAGSGDASGGTAGGGTMGAAGATGGRSGIPDGTGQNCPPYPYIGNACPPGSAALACAVNGTRLLQSSTAVYLLGLLRVGLFRVDPSGLTPISAFTDGDDVRQVDEGYLYYLHLSTAWRRRLDGGAPPELIWDCTSVQGLVVDASSIFLLAEGQLLRLDKPGVSGPAPTSPSSLPAADGTLVVDDQNIYRIDYTGEFTVSDKTGPACSCTCERSAPPGGGGAGGSIGGVVGSAGADGVGGQGGVSGSGGGGTGGGGGPAGSAGSTEVPACVSPPSPTATSDAGAAIESLVSSCPSDGVRRGQVLNNLGSLPQVSQDADALYVSYGVAELFRVPKSGDAPQRLLPSQLIETFALDGSYLYAIVSDGLTHQVTRRQLVRMKGDGSDVTVLSDVAVDGVYPSSMVATKDAIYYVLSHGSGGDGCRLLFDLYRLPLPGDLDGGTDGGIDARDGEIAVGTDGATDGGMSGGQ